MRRFFGSAVFAVALLIFSALPAGAVSSAQLKAKALSLSNFPTGWSIDNHKSSSGADESLCLKHLTVSVKHDAKVTVEFNQSTVPALKEDLETGPSVVRVIGSSPLNWAVANRSALRQMASRLAGL